MATAEQVRQDGIPLSDCEKRLWADIDWAEHSSEVRDKYAGQWIAIYDRAVVANGADREQVLRHGANKVQRPPEEVAVWPVVSDIAIITDPPASAAEF